MADRRQTPDEREVYDATGPLQRAAAGDHAVDHERRPAEVFAPAEYLWDEMAARGWDLSDLWDASRLTWREVVDVLAGGQITEQTALGLGEAFGTSTQFWLNLWVAWDRRNL